MYYEIKRNWKCIDSGRVYNLFLEVMERAVAVGLWPKEKRYPLLFSRTSVRVLGTCYTNRRADGYTYSSIVLTAELFNFSDDHIRKVIVHEVAHACTPYTRHGFEWRYAAHLLAAKWGYRIERLESDSEINLAMSNLRKTVSQYKYELYCPVCGATWKYKCNCQAVQNPQRYQCSKDKVKLLSRKI